MAYPTVRLVEITETIIVFMIIRINFGFRTAIHHSKLNDVGKAVDHLGTMLRRKTTHKGKTIKVPRNRSINTKIAFSLICFATPALNQTEL